MTNYVVTGLAKRRAELTGEIESTHDRLRQMVQDLEHLDATILQFDPDYEIEAIKPKAFRPPKDWSRRGEMTRIILSILRQAAEPLTARDIALQLLVERALDKSDQKLLRLMTKRWRFGYSAKKAWQSVSKGRVSTCFGRLRGSRPATPPILSFLQYTK